MLLKDPGHDPRARRTRKLLQQAMNALMSQKSFTDITIQDITARAEVNRATFYKHFVDKYDLVNAIIRDNFQQSLDAKLPREPLFTRDNLYLLIQTVYEYLASFPGQCSTVHLHRDQGLMVQQVQVQTYTTLLEWLRRSPVPVDTAALDLTAMMASWAIFGPILQSSWASGHHKTINQALVEQLLNLVESAFKVYMVEDAALLAR
ncbi:MAG: TetR/AcrR family transcriptional regulator [Anaerolineae bacterium]